MTLRIHAYDPEKEVKEAINRWHPLNSALRAVRCFCVEMCKCGSTSEVRHCISNGCALFEFRFGKNPPRLKRKMSAEQRAANAERLRKARADRGSKAQGR